LDGIENLRMNQPTSDQVHPAYWMTSIVLHNRFTPYRNTVREYLKSHNIDSRPFFPQMSSFRMFDDYHNPNAKFIGSAGINLPSPHDLTHEEVIYICDVLKEILSVW